LKNYCLYVGVKHSQTGLVLKGDKISSTYRPKYPTSAQEKIILPSHTVLSSTKLLNGQYAMDVLIEDVALLTSLKEFESWQEVDSVFRVFGKELYAAEISLYATKDAQKANYSSSFLNDHPDALSGFIGSIKSGSIYHGDFFKHTLKK